MTEALSADQVGSFVYRKNAIINGDMRIAQRGASFAAIANGIYSLDRWKYGKVGAAVHTVTQDSSVPNDQFGYSLKLDCTTADASVAAGDIIFLEQRIEGYNFRKFVGQTATLSFWVKAGKTGTMCAAFRSGGGDRSYISEVTINSANTWEKKSVTLDFDYSGGIWNYGTGTGLTVFFTLLSGSTYQATADVWQSGNFVATSNQTNFCDNTDATCDVWFTGIQLEIGKQATDFEFLDQRTQFADCLRYYEKIGGEPAFVMFGAGHWESATNASGVYGFYPKRAQPTPTWFGAFIVRKLNANIAATGVVLYAQGDRTGQWTAAVAGGGAGDAGSYIFTNSSSNDYIALDAEL